MEHGVLIETLWNVKEESEVLKHTLRPGINRNIVECKVSCVVYVFDTVEVLIETLWNVKLCIL